MKISDIVTKSNSMIGDLTRKKVLISRAFHEIGLTPTFDIEGSTSPRDVFLYCEGITLHALTSIRRRTRLNIIPAETVTFTAELAHYYPAQYPFHLFPKKTSRLDIDNVKTLHSLNKHVKEITEMLVIRNSASYSLPTHLLGLLLIKGRFDIQINARSAPPHRRLEEILFMYQTDKDIISCQAELIDSGFEKQARL